jgi:hypothetical protein
LSQPLDRQINFELNLRESVHRDTIMKVTNKMQPNRLIYFSLSALHVSEIVIVQHQEHLTAFTVSGSIHPGCCLLVSKTHQQDATV